MKTFSKVCSAVVLAFASLAATALPVAPVTALPDSTSICLKSYPQKICEQRAYEERFMAMFLTLFLAPWGFSALLLVLLGENKPGGK